MNEYFNEQQLTGRISSAPNTSAALSVVTGEGGGERKTSISTLPSSMEAENGVLGGIISGEGGYLEVVSLGLQAEDFYFPQNRAIFDAMGLISSRNDPICLITLINVLRSRGKLDQVGGPAHLSELEGAFTNGAHLIAYTKIVQNKSSLRKLIATTAQIGAAARTTVEDAEGLLDEAEREILAIRGQSTGQGNIKMHVLVDRVLKRIDSGTGENVTGVSSGFPELDKLTCGFQPGELIIIAARPSMGKTAFVLNITANVAMGLNVPVAFFSLEMSAEQLTQRLIGSESKTDLLLIRRGGLGAEDAGRVLRCAGRIGESPICLDETASITVAQLRAKCRRFVHQNRIKLLVIDYLQLMGSSRNYDNKATEIGEISRGLKALAREFNIAVIALSQLNRGVESRTDKRPMMSDLRESGAIEQDADVIVFLYREEYYLRDSTPNERVGMAEVIIAKNRNGPTGVLSLQFIKHLARFQNVGNYPEVPDNLAGR